jgi:heme/copper-type cytochrome/quinol oxidase subunit 2
MARFFAATIILIAIASAIPILRHSWPAPQDISLHGHLIDEQMSDTMAEAGISFLAAQFILAIFIWKYSNRPKDAKIGKLPGGAKGLVIAAFLLVGTEVLALGIFGTKAWASVYFTPPAADAVPIQVQAGQFAFYFRYPGDGQSAVMASQASLTALPRERVEWLTMESPSLLKTAILLSRLARPLPPS